VTILISAINDNFNHKDTVIYQCSCNTNFTLYYKHSSFVSDRGCQLCFLFCTYFRNVYHFKLLYCFQTIFKFMKQKCSFCSILAIYYLPVT